MAPMVRYMTGATHPAPTLGPWQAASGAAGAGALSSRTGFPPTGAVDEGMGGVLSLTARILPAPATRDSTRRRVRCR